MPFWGRDQVLVRTLTPGGTTDLVTSVMSPPRSHYSTSFLCICKLCFLYVVTHMFVTRHCVFLRYLRVGRSNGVGIGTCYGLGGPGIESW